MRNKRWYNTIPPAPLIKGGNERGDQIFDKTTLRSRGLITKGFHLPYNPKLIERARVLRKNMTEAEKKLWYGLLKNFKYPVLRERPIDNFIVDFYCPKLKLVIEIDGEVHFTSDGKIYDEDRDKILKSYRLKILRFSNWEILRNFDRVCHILENIT